MLPGPVFFHELRSAARRKRSFLLRSVLGLFLLYLFLISAPGWDRPGTSWGEGREYLPGELAGMGSRLFSSMIWLEMMVILFMTPAFLAGSIAEDRQRKILPYLLASPLSAGEIVLGKLAARLINLAVLVMVSLPVVSIALFLGGVAPEQAWLSFAGLFTTLYLMAGLCLVISVYAERPRDAIIRNYLLILAWVCLPGIITVLRQTGPAMETLCHWFDPVMEWISTSSPLELLRHMEFYQGGNDFQQVAWMMGLQAAFGTLLLAWSTLRLRPIERGGPTGRVRALLGGAGNDARPRRLFPRRAVDDRPMIWKECSGGPRGRGLIKRLIMVLVALSAAACLAYWVFEMGLPALYEMSFNGYGSSGTFTARSTLSTSVRVITGFLYCLGGLLLGATAATGITMEREKDTWISLISTLLDGPEIVVGKILGAFWRVRVIFGILLLVWGVGLACGAVHPLGFALALLMTSIYLAFIANLGTYLSLRCKSSGQAIAWTISLLMFLNGGYLLCCIPMGGVNTTLIIAGMTPLFVITSIFSHVDLNWFFSTASLSSNRSDLLGAGVFSLGFYGVAGVFLYLRCLGFFDVAVDRPRRTIWLPPQDVKSKEGIAFLDELGTVPGGEPFASAEESAPPFSQAGETDREPEPR